MVVMRVAFENVGYRYPRNEASLTIGSFVADSGERLALIGPSGSGKTTTLKLLSGILSPETGSVSLGDFRISHAGSRRRRAFRLRHIGFVFQDFQLIDCLSVMDNILLPYRLSSELRLDQSVREWARVLAQEVGLGAKLDRLASRLSQGERQRCAICRAVVARPSVVLADEPTGALDQVNRSRVVGMILGMAKECGSTVLFVTHDLDTLKPFDRIWDFSGDFN